MDSNSKNNNKWLVFLNIPFQMGLIIFIGVKLGLWLDQRFNVYTNMFTIIFSLAAVFISLYNVIKQVNNLNKDKTK